MAKDPIEKLEKTLKKLARSQDEIARRLARIEAKLEAAGPSAPDCEEVIRFLDEFRAGEALGETSLGAWIAVCTTPCLKGGLRTVQCREGMHARLLEARMKELGGSPQHEIPEAIYQAVMTGSASSEKSDAEKVLDFVTRFPDIDEALKPIFEMADRLDGDQETQSLLRTIAQDERSTLEFLGEACALLNA